MSRPVRPPAQTGESSCLAESSRKPAAQGTLAGSEGMATRMETTQLLGLNRDQYKDPVFHSLLPRGKSLGV